MCWIVNKGSREITLSTVSYSCNCCYPCVMSWLPVQHYEYTCSHLHHGHIMLYVYVSVTNTAQEYPHTQSSRWNMVSEETLSVFWSLVIVSTHILHGGIQATRETQFSSASWLARMVWKIFMILISIETQERRIQVSNLIYRMGCDTEKEFSASSTWVKRTAKLWYIVRKV